MSIKFSGKVTYQVKPFGPFFMTYINDGIKDTQYLCPEMPGRMTESVAQDDLVRFAETHQLSPEELPNCPLCGCESALVDLHGSHPMFHVGCSGKECYYNHGMPIFKSIHTAALAWSQIASAELTPCVGCGFIPIFKYSFSKAKYGVVLWTVACSFDVHQPDDSARACSEIFDSGSFVNITDAAKAWNKGNI